MALRSHGKVLALRSHGKSLSVRSLHEKIFPTENDCGMTLSRRR